EVEAAAGRHGVHPIPRTASLAAFGELNFADGEGSVLLAVQVLSFRDFQDAKAQKETTLAGEKIPAILFHAAVAGVGDEAFDAPGGSGGVPYMLYGRKGTRALLLGSALDQG